MIQVPQTQYIPQAPFAQPAVGQPVQYTEQQVPQAQNVVYNYPTGSSYLPAAKDKSQFNGVNIEIINPQGMGANTQGAYTVPAQYYPIQTPAVNTQTPAPAQPLPAAPVEQQVPQPAIPEPQVANAQPETPQAAAPQVDNSQVPNDSVTPELFAGKLKTDDLDAQKAAIEEIAETVKKDENAGPILLDTQVFDALVDVINKDTSNLEAPAPEVIELRNKPQDQLTEEEKEKASTPAPLEKAEINKQYALYTIAYMQERLNNELEKRNGSKLELKDLPCIETVIDTVKGNQNPMLRIGAIAALSHIAKPEYAQDLNTIFELAESDEDERVREAATAAKQALSGAPAEQSAQQAEEPKAEEKK